MPTPMMMTVGSTIIVETSSVTRGTVRAAF